MAISPLQILVPPTPPQTDIFNFSNDEPGLKQRSIGLFYTTVRPQRSGPLIPRFICRSEDTVELVLIALLI